MKQTDVTDKGKFQIKKLEISAVDNPIDIPDTSIQLLGTEIHFSHDRDLCLEHVFDDIEAINKTGLEKLIKQDLIPWLKEAGPGSTDDEKIFKGLKIAWIDYSYYQVNKKYSPTHKIDFFGIFNIVFESSSSYTKELLKSVVYEIYVNKGRVYPWSKYER